MRELQNLCITLRCCILLVAFSPTTCGWQLGLPGGGRVLYHDGILRIRLDASQNDLKVPPSDAKISPSVLSCIHIRDTGTAKGHGAFCIHRPIEGRSFLGFYEGKRIDSLPENPLDQRYILSLDGGANFLDGHERAQDRSIFSPVHLNHADGDQSECNCVCVLCDRNERVAFFSSRRVDVGEELCFDYGSSYWVGREGEKL